LVQQAAELLVAGGLKAEALEDARPAQWSKLIFNASVNGVSALTGLPHSPHFASEEKSTDLGHLVHALIDEGKAVAQAAGINLQDDPWAMIKIGAMTNHPPSMLYDVRRQLPTEVEFLSGAIAREAERAGVAAPLHSTIYRLIKAREAGWTYKDENQPALSHKQHGDDAEDRNNNGRQEDRSNRERIKA
jgi:2-dehydropantoate 2-reductase